MGRFNADSITFRGKVGQLCGQGWRSINVIKTAPQEKYIRTELQGECRDFFKDAVLAAQIAQKSCYPCVGFSTSTRSAWNGRVSQAMDKIKNGNILFNSIPVVPLLTPRTISDGIILRTVSFENDYTNISFSSVSGDSVITFSRDVWYIFCSVPIVYLNDLSLVRVFPGRLKSVDDTTVLRFWNLPRSYIYNVAFYLVTSKYTNDDSNFFWSGFCDNKELPF